MVNCCVPLCKSHKNRNQGEKISFHEFPSDAELRNKWIKSISRNDPVTNEMWMPSEWSKVCSLHFEDSCFNPTLKKRRLNYGSVPSIFPNYPRHTSINVSIKRTFSGMYKQRNADTKLSNPNSFNSNSSLVPNTHLTDERNVPKENLEVLATVATTISQLKPNTSAIVTTKKIYRDMKRKLATAQKKITRLQSKVANLKKESKENYEKYKYYKKLADENGLTNLEEGIKNKDRKALFLKDQLAAYTKKRIIWSDTTIRYAILLSHKSPGAYKMLRKMNVLSLPALSTLKRYIGTCHKESMLSLIKQRLVSEFKNLNEKEIFGSLLLDEMKIKPKLRFVSFSESIIGAVSNHQPGDNVNIEKKLATHLLGFVFSGLTSHYSIPVGYYFTNGLNGEDLHKITLSIIKDIEEIGFIIVRIAADNYQTNISMFQYFCYYDQKPPVFKLTKIEPEVRHPLDSNRKLFLSYDFCHILKNVRNQFISKKRALKKDGESINSYPLEQIWKLQKDWTIKPVRHLNEKHLKPTNMQKMNVKLAVQLFSTDVIAVLKYLQKYGLMYGIKGFENCNKTIEFMEYFNKWFTIHNVKNTFATFHKNNPLMAAFFSIEDDRLQWLENDFLNYLQSWKASAETPLNFLTERTYNAIVITTKATILSIKYLLNAGFNYVLTRRFSTDDIESLFSSIRQLNGANDQTDAENCIKSLQKILITGKIISSEYASVKNNYLDEDKELLKQTKIEKCVENNKTLDLQNILQSDLVQIENFSFTTVRGLKSASLAVLGGYLVRTVMDFNVIDCLSCKEILITPQTECPVLGIIKNLDNGKYCYPKPLFVGFLIILEKALEKVIPYIISNAQTLTTLVNLFLPHMAKNKMFYCIKNSEEHATKISRILLTKFIKPYLSNYCQTKTDALPSKPIPYKPHDLSRKYRKLQ